MIAIRGLKVARRDPIAMFSAAGVKLRVEDKKSDLPELISVLMRCGVARPGRFHTFGWDNAAASKPCP